MQRDIALWLTFVSCPESSSAQLFFWFFFKAPPSKVDLEKLDSLKADSEAYHVTDEAFYFYAPEGIGRSKLIASFRNR